MKYLSRPELDSLLAEAKKSSPADHLFVLLTVSHGLRVSEVLSLTHENLKDGHLTIQRLKGSCKTSQRLLPAEIAALAEYSIKSGKLFNMHRQTAWRRIKAFGVAAGIESIRVFPHCLKHTTAKIGLAGGMTLPELQTYLGHKSGSSTMAYLRESDETASLAFAAAAGL
jgi:integrase/recombinase XerD